MHRLRSPLVALIALLMVAGPLASRISQVDPTDPLQISTPTPYERSTGQALDQAELSRSFPFDQSDDVSISNPIFMNDQFLLVSHNHVMSLDGQSLIPQWETTLNNRAIRYSTIFVIPELEDPSHILIRTETESYLLDLLDGEIIWAISAITSEGSINQLTNGNLLYIDDADNSRSSVLIDGLSGNALLARENVTSYEAGDEWLYLLTENALESINPESGELLWSLPITEIEWLQVQDQTIYLRNVDEIVAVDAESGKEKWLRFVEYGSTLHTSAEGHVLLSTRGGIAKLDSATGLDTGRLPNATFVSMHSSILIATIGSDLIGTNVDTNEVAWQMDGVRGIEYWDIIGNIRMFITSGNTVLLIDNDTGMLLHPELAREYRTFSDSDSVVLTVDQRLIAFDGESKQIAWTHESTEPIESTFQSDGLLILMTESTITSIDHDTGNERHSFAQKADWVEFRVIDGFLFFQAEDGITFVDMKFGYSSPLEAVSNLHNLWVTSFDDIVYIKSQRQLFVFDPTMGGMYAPPYRSDLFRTDANGNALITSSVISFVESNGQLRWETRNTQTPSSMTIWPDQGLVSLQLSEEVRILDALNGDVLWSAPIPSPPEAWWFNWHVVTVDGLIHFTPEGAEWWTLPSAHASTLTKETTLFASPSHEAVERGTYPVGTVVTPTGNERERSDGRWLEVSVEGVTGWAHENDLSEGEAVPASTPAA